MNKEKQKKVWLVDDDAIHNMALEIIITKSGFAADVNAFNKARYALEALETAQNNGDKFPDIIFLDLNMNDLNGWEFLDKFHEFDDTYKKDCKVFVLTSSVNFKDKEKAANYHEVEQFLSKPILLNFFESCVN